MRGHRLWIIIFLLLALGVTALEAISSASNKMTFLDQVIISVFSPFQKAFIRTKDFTVHLTNANAYADQQTQLKSEIYFLKQQLARLQMFEKENEDLHELLNLKNSFEGHTLAAQVIGRDPSQWFVTLTIDKGSDDGVYPDQGVVGNGAVVGKVMDVSSHAARVVLLTSPRMIFPVEILPGGGQGISYGNGESGCVIRYVSSSASVKPGDEVVTSGLGHIFPKKGIPVGTISTVKQDSVAPFFNELSLKSDVDLSDLWVVMVLQP